MSPTNPPNPASQTHPTGERRAELERIKAVMWPPDESPEARQERIARNLAEWDSLEPPNYVLSAEDWKLIDQASLLDEDGG
jgi:hypothetical protein